MKLLLTGATGFVGSKVLKRLVARAKDEIVVLSGASHIEGAANTISVIPAMNYEFDENYLVNHNADVEVVIHMGAFTPKSGSEANFIDASTSNIRNTEKLLNAVRRCGNTKRLVFISTLDVYEVSDETISESTATIPQTMYGWSKLYCEQMVKAFAEQNRIQYVILRLGHVYGEGEEKYRKVMPVMIRNALNSNDITIFGDGEARRTFIYIDDVVDAIINSTGYKTSDTINVVGTESISINELASLVVEQTGNRVQIKHIPSDAPNRNMCFDNRKLMSTLLQTLTPLETGLKREIEYLKRQIV